jgi:hypothetical protein
MTIHIPISSEAEDRLRRRAEACGEDLTSYVAKLLAHFAEPPTPLKELSGPIFEAFKASGMTDDELGDLLEKAKHEMRAERRAKQRP